MYKEMEVAQRAKAIERLAFQLDVLNRLVKGPYVSGPPLGLADAALFPTLAFCRFILPQYFGWEDLFAHRQQLGQYWAAIEADPAGAKVGLLSKDMVVWDQTAPKYELLVCMYYSIPCRGASCCIQCQSSSPQHQVKVIEGLWCLT